MKKHGEFQENVQLDIKEKQKLNIDAKVLITKKYKNLKKYLCIGGIVGAGLLFNGCYPGYVASEPVYTETYRPESPGNMHIWVEGNWNYNHSTQSYVHKDGYWKKSHHGRKFIPGHWVSTPKGHRWIDGHWTR